MWPTKEHHPKPASIFHDNHEAVLIRWNLPYLDLHYPGTSIVQITQISHVACSLLTIMKFGLDESTRRGPKGCCLPVRWLVYSTNNNYNFTAHSSDHECSVVASSSAHKLHSTN